MKLGHKLFRYARTAEKNQPQFEGFKTKIAIVVRVFCLNFSGSAADAQYIANKEAVGAHFALTQGLNNATWARTVAEAG